MIQADNGTTDYNGAFAKADVDNPTADARIFLTDGGHNVGAYAEAHLAHNVPTYVIGLGIVAGEDQARLQKIAADTRGRYFALEDSSQLQPVMNKVGAALTCQTPPRQFIDLLEPGQSKAHNVGVPKRTSKVQIALTWSNPLDKFKIYGVRIVTGRRTVAVASSASPRAAKPQAPQAEGQAENQLDVHRADRLTPAEGKAAVQSPGGETRLRRVPGDPDHAGQPAAQVALQPGFQERDRCGRRTAAASTVLSGLAWLD